MESLTIPASVRSIGPYAFARCSNLRSIVIASGSRLEKTDENAFYGLVGLRVIWVDGDAPVGIQRFLP